MTFIKKIRPLTQSTPHIDEARIEITTIVNNFTHTNYEIEAIYQNASFEWYKTYKFDFLPKFELFCKSIRDGQEPKYSSAQILELLNEIVITRPDYPHCLKPCQLFMNFTQIANAFLRSDFYKYNNKMYDLYTLCEDIWNCFAERVRLECHDSYYTPYVDTCNYM